MSETEITKKMEITIDVYKPSGKWYTGVTVEANDIHPWEDYFKRFIWNNMSAHIGAGYVVVKDTGKYDTFHNCLFRYDELKRELVGA